MAEESKYTADKELKSIKINIDGIQVPDLNFSNTIETLDNVQNENKEESDQVKSEILIAINSDIQYAYFNILNGSSSISNSISAKNKYKKIITDIADKIWEESGYGPGLSPRATVKLNGSKNPTIDNLKNESYTDYKKIFDSCLIDEMKIYYNGLIASEDFSKDYDIDDKKFKKAISNVKNYTFKVYNEYQDYISNNCLMVYGKSKECFDWYIGKKNTTWESGRDKGTNKNNVLSRFYDIATESVGGNHYVIKNIGFVPDDNVINKWIDDINKELKQYGLEVNSTVEHVLKRRRESREAQFNGDIIVSKKNKKNSDKPPFEQLKDDLKKGGELETAFKKLFNTQSYDNKNIGNIKDFLKENNTFDIAIEHAFTSPGFIWEYVFRAIKSLLEGGGISDANNAENILKYFKEKTTNILDNEFGNEHPTTIDVNSYYDMYSTMTPRVKLYFRYGKGTGEGVEINNTKYSFIKSLNMTDNGAKKFKIVLYDRDFNTPIDVGNGKKMSLDQIIAKTLSLNSNAYGETNNASNSGIKKYKIAANNFGDIIGFNAPDSTIGNLVISYGFNEHNTDGSPETYIQGVEKTKIGDAEYLMINGTKYLTGGKDRNGDTLNPRKGRWWHTNTEGDTDTTNKITQLELINSVNSSTSETRNFETLITGYSTRFSEGGIYYEIEAIEYTNSMLNNYKIFQRYTNIVGTPSEVLYSVMKIVEGLFGNEIDVRLSPELAEEGGIYEEEEDVTEENEESGEETSVGKRIKEVSVSLGTKDALSQYLDSDGSGKITRGKIEDNLKQSKAKMYKSVASLLNDLCAVMPARLDKDSSMEEVTVQDENGDSKKVSNERKTYRRFMYTFINNKKTIIFHYQKPRRVRYIRKYEWGPANCKNSVIKSVDIKTENEFSLLSSMTVINSRDKVLDKTIYLRDGTKLETQEDKKGNKFIVQTGNKADYIYSPGNDPLNDEAQIALSYSQCLYQGKITILGDPFYNFDKNMVPYTYPIYLNFRLPYSEIAIYDKYKKTDSEEAVNLRTGYSHFMSGYYVVTSIEQNISESGFTTTLGVMSYPGLTKDIL